MEKDTPLTFPVIKFYDEAIASCQKLFNVSISEEDLRKPTPQFVRKLFLDLVTESMQISTEQMVQPHFKFLSAFQNPDISQEGASFLYFTILLQRFMHAALEKDFSINDLTNPKPKRIMRCISAIINFEKFKDSQANYFDTVVEEKEILHNQRSELLRRNQELKEKIAKIRAARCEEEEKIQQNLAVADNLERAVNELNRQQASDFKQTQQLKTEIAEQTSKEAELKVIIAKNREECEKLKAQIVTSPEKFRGELSRMNAAINACKDSIAEKNKKLLEKENQEESIALLEDNCAQAFRLISSLEDETEKLRNLQHKLQDLHDVVTADNEALVQKDYHYKNAKRQLTSQNEKLSRLERTNEKRFSAKNDDREHRKKNVESLEQSQKHCQAEISEIMTEFQEVVKKLNELEDSHNNEMNTMQDAYQQLISSINNYHGMLEEGCKDLLSSM
ncbi:probable kinetochore protein nuf2 isoform X2 [Dendronephthya gigantea]|uniref:probable kinetochore protein nuf2 isoform X2 n=1 Tax=Dendronephthya gigantea TaxID=151771 RepID=UPI00106B31E5|nr:probable kinetochore protein nuf2 isoform X2 [Dendronephthya gigantea]